MKAKRWVDVDWETGATSPMQLRMVQLLRIGSSASGAASCKHSLSFGGDRATAEGGGLERLPTDCDEKSPKRR